MDQQQEKDRRRIELQTLGPQTLLTLAHQKGINLLNRPFVIEAILDDEFPELRDEQTLSSGRMTV